MTRADEPADKPADKPADRDDVDRAFAEMIAGYHLTSDRPDPLTETQRSPRTPEPADTSWADDHPLFRFDSPPEPQERPEPVEHYEAPALEPLPKPAWPVLVGWLGMGYALLVLLAVVVGITLPSWAGWLGLIGFVGGFAIMVARLPRQRPPGDDGAVV